MKSFIQLQRLQISPAYITFPLLWLNPRRLGFLPTLLVRAQQGSGRFHVFCLHYRKSVNFKWTRNLVNMECLVAEICSARGNESEECHLGFKSESPGNQRNSTNAFPLWCSVCLSHDSNLISRCIVRFSHAKMCKVLYLTRIRFHRNMSYLRNSELSLFETFPMKVPAIPNKVAISHLPNSERVTP